MVLRILLVLGLLVALTSPARAGLELGAGLGVNSCLPDEAANCERLWPNVDLSASLEYRWEQVGLGLDYDYGWLTPSGEGADQGRGRRS